MRAPKTDEAAAVVLEGMTQLGIAVKAGFISLPLKGSRLTHVEDTDKIRQALDTLLRTNEAKELFDKALASAYAKSSDNPSKVESDYAKKFVGEIVG